MVEWAKRMTWKGIRSLVALSRKAYQKGVALSKRAMQAVEARLARHSELPKWDIGLSRCRGSFWPVRSSYRDCPFLNILTSSMVCLDAAGR
jgi:hypothetical protein